MATARESRGWNQQDISDRINLNISHVKNLETDNYSELPPTTFVMGYIRSYATLLDLDPEPFIARFREKTNVQPPVQIALVEDQEPGLIEQFNVQLIVLVAAALILILALAWWLLGDSLNEQSVVDESAQTDQLHESETGSSAEFLPDEVLFKESREKSEERTPENAIADANKPATNIPITNETFDNSSAITTSGEIEEAKLQDKQRQADVSLDEKKPKLNSDRAEVVKNESIAELPSEPNRDLDNETLNVEKRERVVLPPEDVLQLKALEDSWVSVTDADSVRLMYGVLTSGTPRKLEGIAPFSMVFGAASGIEVILNGKPVDFSSMIRKSKTARFLIRADGTLERQSQDD